MPFSRKINIQRGPNEKTIAELRHDMADEIKNSISPHPEIITMQQKFSIPVACLVSRWSAWRSACRSRATASSPGSSSESR